MRASAFAAIFFKLAKTLRLVSIYINRWELFGTPSFGFTFSHFLVLKSLDGSVHDPIQAFPTPFFSSKLTNLLPMRMVVFEGTFHSFFVIHFQPFLFWYLRDVSSAGSLHHCRSLHRRCRFLKGGRDGASALEIEQTDAVSSSVVHSILQCVKTCKEST